MKKWWKRFAKSPAVRYTTKFVLLFLTVVVILAPLGARLAPTVCCWWVMVIATILGMGWLLFIKKWPF